MFKNNINLATFFGLGALCLGFLIAGVYFQLIDDARFDSRTEEDKTWLFITGVLLLLYFINAIAFLLQKKWARIGMIILLIIGLVGFSVLMFSLLHEINNAPYVTIGMGVFGYGVLFLGLVYLSNHYILDHFNNNFHSREEIPDILDSDF